jgi:hypothetical protein
MAFNEALCRLLELGFRYLIKHLVTCTDRSTAIVCYSFVLPQPEEKCETDQGASNNNNNSLSREVGGEL